jgi:RES domain-containing protein
MKLFRIAKKEFAEDLSGQGAFLYGGRWNYKGERMLYTSENPSLALLENLVHLQGLRILPQLVLVELEIGTETQNLEEISPEKLPTEWKKNPAPNSLKEMGSEFLERMKSPVLVVPSVVVPWDKNLLINPLHPEAKSLRITKMEEFAAEERLFS